MANLRVGSFGAQVAQIASPGNIRVGAFGVQVAQVAAAPGTLRIGSFGVQVAQVASTAGGNVRVGSLGVQVVHETQPLHPNAAVLGVFLAYAGGVVLEALAPFASTVPGDSHFESDWLIADDADVDFTTPVVEVTYGVADGEKLTRLIQEPLAAGLYRAKLIFRGTTADAPDSNVVTFEVLAVPTNVPDAPTLSVVLEGPDFGVVGTTAMTHPEGVTSEDLYPGVDLPFPKLLHLRVTPPSGPVFNVFSFSAVAELSVLLEELAAGIHDVEGRWLEGKYSAFGGFSAAIELEAEGVDGGEEGEEEDVTYTVECTGHTLTITLIDTIPTTQTVWWRVGRATSGGAFDRSSNWFDSGGGRLQRVFDLLDAGLTIAVGWRRKRAGVWLTNDSFSTPQVLCPTPDVCPPPFFVNAPGTPYVDSFTLSWDFRQLSSFAPTDNYAFRVRHKPFEADEDEWVTLEEELEALEFLVDFLDELEEDVFQCIGVTTLAANQESAEAVFLFRRRSSVGVTVRDFKAESALPADGLLMHDGAGIGTDRTTIEHLPELGVCFRKTVRNPVEFQPGYLALTDLGLTPLGSRGVLTFTLRVRDENRSKYDRFTPITFERAGIALCLTGNGADRTTWSSLIIRRRSGTEGWAWTGSYRAPGSTGDAAGANAEYNRTNFGNAQPFVYGRAFDLRADVTSKRLGTPLVQSTVDTRAVADVHYPSNTVNGQMTYVLVWEFLKIASAWTLRYALQGPDINGTWLQAPLTIPELQLQNSVLRQLPVGYIGLVSENPASGGDSIFHSLVVEEITDVPEIISTCPLPPATLAVGYEYELQLDVALPEGFTFIITSGGLPTGLELDADTGVISGTPTEPGTWRFCIALTDGFTEEGEFCCDLAVAEGASLAGCAKDFLVLGSRVGASSGNIYLPDALESFTSELSEEPGTILAVRTLTYAAQGTDGEADFRRLYVTGYNRGFVGMWVMPFFNGRPYQQLRKWLSAPAPQSNRTERFHLWMDIAEVKTLVEAEGPQTGAVRASVWAVQIETTDPDDQWHLETATMLHSPINDARIIQTTELQLQDRL